MGKKRCVACGALFQARPQVPSQSYCSAPTCQRERKREWQRRKLHTDPDHRENKARAQRAWGERNPDYWREYRDSHPDYADRNRTMQHGRNAVSRIRAIAKMNVSILKNPLQSGVYEMKFLQPGAIVKKDVLTVEIIEHVCSAEANPQNCKDRT